MSIPPRLAGKFNDVLGMDAAEDLVNWMDEMRADHSELRHEVRSVREELNALKTEVASLSRKVDEGFKAMDAKFDKLLENSYAVGQRLESLRGHFIAGMPLSGLPQSPLPSACYSFCETEWHLALIFTATLPLG